MSLAAVIEGLVERVQTLDPKPVVLDYEPKVTEVSPIVLVLNNGFDGRTQAGQVTVTPWDVTVVLLVKWQENQGAERQMTALVDSVLLAIDQDIQLGGRLVSGVVQVPRGEADFVTFGSMLCRRVKITVRAVDKTAFAGAIS